MEEFGGVDAIDRRGPSPDEFAGAATSGEAPSTKLSLTTRTRSGFPETWIWLNTNSG